MLHVSAGSPVPFCTTLRQIILLLALNCFLWKHVIIWLTWKECVSNSISTDLILEIMLKDSSPLKSIILQRSNKSWMHVCFFMQVGNISRLNQKLYFPLSVFQRGFQSKQDITSITKTWSLLHCYSRQYLLHVIVTRLLHSLFVWQPKMSGPFPRAAADGLSSCVYGGALEEHNWKPTHVTCWVHWKFEHI